MVQLTWTNAQSITVDANDFVRVRRTYPDYDGPEGQSRVDWLQTDLFLENAPDIAASVSSERVGTGGKPLVSLTMPGGAPVWFAGEKSAGPLYVVPNPAYGINSAVLIGNKVQYVADTPQSVAEIVGAAGGRVLPIRTAVKSLAADDETTETFEIWDADIVQAKRPTHLGDGIDTQKSIDPNPFGVGDVNAVRLDAGLGSTNGPKAPQ